MINFSRCIATVAAVCDNFLWKPFSFALLVVIKLIPISNPLHVWLCYDFESVCMKITWSQNNQCDILLRSATETKATLIPNDFCSPKYISVLEKNVSHFEISQQEFCFHFSHELMITWNYNLMTGLIWIIRTNSLLKNCFNSFDGNYCLFYIKFWKFQINLFNSTNGCWF